MVATKRKAITSAPRVKTSESILKKQSEIGRIDLRRALLLEFQQESQAKRGVKVKGAMSKDAADVVKTVRLEDRAGYPVKVGKLKPEDWEAKDGMKIMVDLTRASWLPDDWGQGIKETKEITRSRQGVGGTINVFCGPDGDVVFHKPVVEKIVGRKLNFLDGFNGVKRTAGLQRKQTDEKAFFNMLDRNEKAHLPKADELHFCVVSARRTKSKEGLSDIANVQAQFDAAGVKPTWYVDEESVAEYKKLGLNAVVGGKLTEARNKALDDAEKMKKACVQCSDDISRWQFAEGEAASVRTDAAMNAAYAAATIHIVSPVACARFLIAKMRAKGPNRPRLAGIYPLGSNGRSFGGAMYTQYNFIIGDFFVADGSPVRFDLNMKLKEDYDFTCAHMKKHGSVLRCNRMSINVKHYTNSGGAVAVRNTKEEQRNIAILKKKWHGVFHDNPLRENEVKLRWKVNKHAVHAGQDDTDDEAWSLGASKDVPKNAKRVKTLAKNEKPSSKNVQVGRFTQSCKKVKRALK